MRRTRLLSVLGLSAAAAAASAAIPFIASSAAGDYRLPDLVSVAPPTDNAYLIEGSFAGTSEDATANRLLLRFDGFIDNRGPGPVHFEGVPASRNVRQWVLPNGRQPLSIGPAPNYDTLGGPLVVPTGGDTIPMPNYTGPLDNQAESDDACVPKAQEFQFPAPADPSRPKAGPCVIYSTQESGNNALSDGHNHWHLVGAARYSLWNEAGTAVAAPGQKVGFCLYDYDRIPDMGQNPDRPFYGAYQSSTNNFCRQNDVAGTGTLIEGINAGYRDVYESRLAWQWIDVSNVPPGKYRTGGEVDPFNRIWETNELNGIAKSTGTITIPGWVPKAGLSANTPSGAPVAITLQAEPAIGGQCKKDPRLSNRSVRCGAQGDSSGPYVPSESFRRFVITQQPAHGTITVQGSESGTRPGAFSNPVITYTPKPGVTDKTDTFSFAVFDKASRYPLTLTSTSAMVNIGRGSAAISVSGAPQNLDTGAQVALGATVTGLPTGVNGAVTWSVNGIAGGDSTVGTVSPTGVYAAPSTPPAGGTVTVRATLAANPAVFADVTLNITTPPPPQPQPLPFVPAQSPSTTTPAPATPATPSAPTPPSGRTSSTPQGARLETPLIARVGGRVFIRVKPPVTGRLAVSVFSNGKRVKSCVFAAVKGRSTYCVVRDSRFMKVKSMRKIRVVIVQQPLEGGKALRVLATKARI